jgi:hypothetical protein
VKQDGVIILVQYRIYVIMLTVGPTEVVMLPMGTVFVKVDGVEVVVKFKIYAIM